jgi:hypothetical protein
MATAQEVTAELYDALRTNNWLRRRVGFENTTTAKAGPRRNSSTVLSFTNTDGQTVTITTTVV